MLTALVVLVVTSFMLVSAYVRGCIPAVATFGSWWLILTAGWFGVGVSMTVLDAPTMLKAMWLASLWAGPIILFMVDASINHPKDFLLTLPALAAHLWALSVLMAVQP